MNAPANISIIPDYREGCAARPCNECDGHGRVWDGKGKGGNADYKARKTTHSKLLWRTIVQFYVSPKSIGAPPSPKFIVLREPLRRHPARRPARDAPWGEVGFGARAPRVAAHGPA